MDVWLNAGPTATGNVAQTFIGGPGGGTVNLLNHGGAVVSFGIVGPDTIAFQTANVNSAFTTVDPTTSTMRSLGLLTQTTRLIFTFLACSPVLVVYLPTQTALPQ